MRSLRGVKEMGTVCMKSDERCMALDMLGW